MKACKSTAVTADKIAKIKIDEVSAEDQAASVFYSLVYFKELGGTDNVAKGKELIGKLKEVSEDFVALDSTAILESLSKPDDPNG